MIWPCWAASISAASRPAVRRCAARSSASCRLVEEGGYIPELDHSIPPDISWPDFCEYIEYLKFRLGRG